MVGNVLALGVVFGAMTVFGAEGDGWRNVSVDRVKLHGSLGWRIDLTITNNLMQIDLERDFFAPFRHKMAKGGFVGLGKLLDAAAYLAKYSGASDVIERKNLIAKVIADTQDEDGYVGYFRPESRMKDLWDLHETGFLIQGLVTDWRLFGRERSLAAARKAADYVVSKWPDLRDGWEFHHITDRETTLGLAHGFIKLFEATGDARYLEFARCERALLEWNAPIVCGREGMLYGQAYGYLGTALEQLELYGIRPDERLLRTSFRALRHMVAGEGLLVDGTGGIGECWTDDQDCEGSVGETCMATYQMLFYDRLLRLEKADVALLGDLMERLALNAFPAAQRRDGRRLRYYTPLNGLRKYFETDAYCCPNNFRRTVGRLPEYVYYERDGAVLANLFEASDALADVGKTKVRIHCETDYPNTGRIKYVLSPEKPAQFSFRFRMPRWCHGGSVTVNGKKVTYPMSSGEIVSLPRVWKPGDVVCMDLPMEVRFIRGRRRQFGRFAVMRGPQLYALDTRKVKGMEKIHPLDAGNVITLDPGQIPASVVADDAARPNGTAIRTRANAQEFGDGVKPTDPEVTLTEFADPDNTLTYFRTPLPHSPLLSDDELFVGEERIAR